MFQQAVEALLDTENLLRVEPVRVLPPGFHIAVPSLFRPHT